VYSARNLSACILIPITSSSPKAKRVEFRCPDPSSNPYLAFAAMLMAGIDGIVNKINHLLQLIRISTNSKVQKLLQSHKSQVHLMQYLTASKRIMSSLQRVESSQKISSLLGLNGSARTKLIMCDYVHIQQSLSSTTTFKKSRKSPVRDGGAFSLR